MSVRRAMTFAGAVALATAGVGIGVPTPAMASGGSLGCSTTSHNQATGLNTWECVLRDNAVTDTAWYGPNVDPRSNGATVATGTCRPVTYHYRYYITVQYRSGGVPASVTSAPFLCQYNGAD